MDISGSQEMQECNVKWQMNIFSSVCLAISLMLLTFPFLLWLSHKNQFSGLFSKLLLSEYCALSPWNMDMYKTVFFNNNIDDWLFWKVVETKTENFRQPLKVERQRVCMTLKRVFQMKTFFASSLGRSIATRKEAMKIIIKAIRRN